MGLIKIIKYISKWNVDIDLRLIDSYWNKWIIKFYGEWVFGNVEMLDKGFVDKFGKYLFDMKSNIYVFNFCLVNNICIDMFNLEKFDNLFALKWSNMNFKLFRKMLNIYDFNFLQMDQEIANVKILKYLLWIINFNRREMYFVIRSYSNVKSCVLQFEILGVTQNWISDIDNLFSYYDIVGRLIYKYGIKCKMEIYKKYLIIFKRNWVDVNKYLIIFEKYYSNKNKSKYEIDFLKSVRMICNN